MNITIIGTGCDALCDWGRAKDYVRMQLRGEGEGVNKVAYWNNAPAWLPPQLCSNVSVE